MLEIKCCLKGVTLFLYKVESQQRKLLYKHTSQYLKLLNQDTPSEVSNGSVAYDDFEGQENTIFILLANFDNILSHMRFQKLGRPDFFVSFKLENRDNPDKIGTVGRYVQMIALI